MKLLFLQRNTKAPETNCESLSIVKVLTAKLCSKLPGRWGYTAEILIVLVVTWRQMDYITLVSNYLAQTATFWCNVTEHPTLDVSFSLHSQLENFFISPHLAGPGSIWLAISSWIAHAYVWLPLIGPPELRLCDLGQGDLILRTVCFFNSFTSQLTSEKRQIDKRVNILVLVFDVHESLSASNAAVCRSR